MAKAVYADELTTSEYDRLLSAPCSELRLTTSGREVIVYHDLNNTQLYWLAKELGYNQQSDTLYRVLEAIYLDEPMYDSYFKKKRSGGVRKIHSPIDSLKDVQGRVLKNVLDLYPTSGSAFGYSKGSIFDAINPHLAASNQILFSTDIKDAFGSVEFESVFQALYGLPMSMNYKNRSEKGYLSWGVAYALCRIVTCGQKLPQGAPTSPYLFDMVFLSLDWNLERLARNVGGMYTRFADNIYFSMPKAEFPGAVARAIIRTIHENRGCRWAGLMQARHFKCHKTTTRTLEDEAIRVLGVNVAGGKIHPTRQLKKRIRLSVHRLNWLLLNTPYDIESIVKCWGILQGQMSFASQAVLPDSLLEQYSHARNNYEGLLYNGEIPTTT